MQDTDIKDKAEHVLTAKQIRAAHVALQIGEQEMRRQRALIDRLYYKSKAQHRRAKWFQALDGQRKCMRRLLSHGGVGAVPGLRREEDDAMLQSQVAPDAVRVEGSLPNRTGQVQRQMQNRRRMRYGDEPIGSEGPSGLIHSVCLALVDAWCAMWNEERAERTTLPKFDRKPSHELTGEQLDRLSFQLLSLAFVLEELSLRIQVTFGILTAQSRTPPAPTFAPLVGTLLAQSAAAHRLVRQTLWGTGPDDATESERNDRSKDRSKAETAVAPLYNRVRACVSFMNGTKTNRRVFTLDASSQSNKTEWHAYLRRIQSCNGRTTNMGWLPDALLMPSSNDDPTKKDAVKQVLSQVASPPPTASLEYDGEDVGEAI